jgi:hypothetical protein
MATYADLQSDWKLIGPGILQREASMSSSGAPRHSGRVTNSGTKPGGTLPDVADVELNLAVACCRWTVSGESGSEICDLSSRVEWDRFLEVIRRHRVQSLVNSALRASGAAPPAPFVEAIIGDARAMAEQNLRSAAESARLLDAFSGAGLDLLFLKGVTLSALAYGDPFLKMSVDIDILVQRDAVGKAIEVLDSLGYMPSAPAVPPSSPRLRRWHERRKESDWCNPRTGLKIDFHSALADNGALIPAIGMASPRQMVTVGRRAFPTLASDDLFAYLSVHGTWSAWYRLKWITDVAGLVHRSGPGAAERFYRHGIARGAGRAPAQALLLMNRLFGLELPPRLRQELDGDPVNAILERLALRELRQDRSPIERRLGTLLIHAARPLLLPGLAFKYSETRRQLHDVFERVTLQA